MCICVKISYVIDYDFVYWLYQQWYDTVHKYAQEKTLTKNQTTRQIFCTSQSFASHREPCIDLKRGTWLQNDKKIPIHTTRLYKERSEDPKVKKVKKRTNHEDDNLQIKRIVSK